MIRLIEAKDVESFRRIRLEALRQEPAAFASTAEDWKSLPDEEWIRRLNAIDVFVAFHEGDPVGIMGLLPQDASKMAHRAIIVMVYVRENMRGSGIADSLLAALTDHARKKGIRQLELTVSAENPAALQFYKRAGYAEIGRIPAGFIHQGREIDEIIMIRRIAD